MSSIIDKCSESDFKDCDVAIRFNEGKVQWSLMDMDALEPMIRVLEFGAKKYSKYNWKKGLPVTQILDSLLRHIQAIMRKEDIDEESKLPHVGHILANAMFLSYTLKNKPEMDDRLQN